MPEFMSDEPLLPNKTQPLKLQGLAYGRLGLFNH
jgi:hypothetical protein